MAELLGNDGTMSEEDGKILEHYRSLYRQAEECKERVQQLKPRIREQLLNVSQLDSAARNAKNRHHRSITQRVASGTDESAVAPLKHEAARTETELAEARTNLLALETELRTLDSGAPHTMDIENARRAAWEAIARDLRTQVPKGIDELVVKIFAATLGYRPAAPFSLALSAVCPLELKREKCEPVAAQLAKEYNIPA